MPELLHAYQKSGHAAATASAKWRRYNHVSYPSSTHGGRFVNNYANARASKYGGFENAGKMPKGAVLAKDSFSVTKAGGVSVGPLFLMEKMGAGFSKASGDWRYTMIMPDGSVFGTTNGKGSAKMKFCAECHAAVGETQDHMFFLPAEYRVK
ncbi:MAG: cytochrome P460 family protein [Alphaproteobacteria bacterium]|nr:cytochrome P460 family protein [Alphaproteobacteria bacterium]